MSERIPPWGVELTYPGYVAVPAKAQHGSKHLRQLPFVFLCHFVQSRQSAPSDSPSPRISHQRSSAVGHERAGSVSRTKKQRLPGTGSQAWLTSSRRIQLDGVLARSASPPNSRAKATALRVARIAARESPCLTTRSDSAPSDNPLTRSSFCSRGACKIARARSVPCSRT